VASIHTATNEEFGMTLHMVSIADKVTLNTGVSPRSSGLAFKLSFYQYSTFIFIHLKETVYSKYNDTQRH
jgi:hypothetical protein